MNLAEFSQKIWQFYKEQGRHDLAWRKTQDPYRIVVSEVMLQQTQVNRVKQKYEEWLEIFPDFKTLADASTADILKVWSGMGYNRRALYLQKIAQIVCKEYNGTLPKDPKTLDTLPGIGAATAHSIATFAFNYPGVFIETNIRRVFIHFFFQDREEVDDKEIVPYIEKTLDKENPREWYYALMDYGAHLPKVLANPNRRSKHYAVQSQFEGSDRQMRGKIIRELIQKVSINSEYVWTFAADKTRIKKNLEALKKEGFIIEEKGVYRIK